MLLLELNFSWIICVMSLSMGYENNLIYPCFIRYIIHYNKRTLVPFISTGIIHFALISLKNFLPRIS